MWNAEEKDFHEITIRGREYDAKMLGVQSVKPPTADSEYWEVGFIDGTTLVTTDVITLRFSPKKAR